MHSASAGRGFILRARWRQGECSGITKVGSKYAEGDRERKREIWCFLFSSGEQMYSDISGENCYWLPSQSAIGNGPAFSLLFFLRKRWVREYDKASGHLVVVRGVDVVGAVGG